MSELLLLSGGLDSTALAALRKPAGALVIDYGHVAAAGELTAASAVSQALSIELHTLRIDCASLGSGMLAGDDTGSPGAPAPEWWPFRNQLLITAAAAWGVTRDFSTVILGAVTSDGERHIDGSQAFLTAIDHLVRMQEGNLRVVAPAIEMTTAELIAASGVEDDVLAWTHSCHRANLACGACPGCFKRAGVLAELGRLQ